MQEALNEWLVIDRGNFEFHMGQYNEPYRSTVKFAEYLQKKIKAIDNTILDLGCGAGAVLGYILDHHPDYAGGGME